MSTGSIRLACGHVCERWLMCEGPAHCGSMVSGPVGSCTRKQAEQVRGKVSRQHFFFGFLPWPESVIWNKPFFPRLLVIPFVTAIESKLEQSGFKGWDTMTENKHFHMSCSSHGVFHIWALAHLSLNTWLKQKDFPLYFLYVPASMLSIL